MSDDDIIGHDAILSDKRNIARPDLSDDRLLSIIHAKAMSDALRIRAARKELGLTQAELGVRMGVLQSVVSDWENGKLQSWREHAEKLAKALEKPKGYFAGPQLNAKPTKGIPVVGEVQAGVFRFALEFPPDERTILPVVALSGVSGVDQVALRVTGPSMDLLYPDGSYVIVIPAGETDVRDGDRVVVYRAQGELREATIKEVRVEGDRIGLWPRSTHPDHQSPFYLAPSDQDGPEIAYVVVGSFRQEERPSPPLKLNARRQSA